jgi:hypothetical protein
MNRVVLTLLALLTGLVAQVSPAQAAALRVGGTEIGALQQGEITTRPASSVAATQPMAQLAGRSAVRPQRLLGSVAAAPVATVLIGIDRARE